MPAPIVFVPATRYISSTYYLSQFSAFPRQVAATGIFPDASKMGCILGKHVTKLGSKLLKISSVIDEEKKLAQLQQAEGTDFPGSDYSSSNYKEWMGQLDLDKALVKDIIWPGTHDSATDKIGIPYVTQPYVQCQTLSIYRQLLQGVRVLDIRVEKEGFVCHGIVKSYRVDVVICDVKRFLNETTSEFIILEIRTEYGHEDPPNFDTWLINELEDYLVPQDVCVFDKTLKEILPKRLICVWKPQALPPPCPGSLLWSSVYLKDNWTDTDLPYTKFQNNMDYLQKQPPVTVREFFYRVENTCTPQATSSVACIRPVTFRIKPFARLFISQAFKNGLGDRLQIFSTDFIEDDFVDACIGATISRINGEFVNRSSVLLNEHK